MQTDFISAPYMQTIEYKPDPQLKKFFTALGYKLITVSVQPERDGAQLTRGRWFSPKNRVRAIPVDTFFTEEVQLELEALQAAGCAIYFVINEGDGKPADESLGNLNCGRQANITTLRTLAIDTDTADYNLLWEKLKSLRLMPHFDNESSPGKHHLYFIIKPVPAEGENIFMWEALQKCLADLVPLLDQSMAERNQVLRIPGFYNQKPTLKSNFKVVIRKVGEAAPYDLKFLYDRLGASKYNEVQEALNGSSSLKETYNKFEFPKGYLSPGERRNTICRYIDRLIENILPINAKEEEYWMWVDSFIKQYINPKEVSDFLPGGSRRQNLINYYNDQIAHRQQKINSRNTAIAQQEFQHLEDVENRTLPDDFYLTFPGDLGMIVREINRYAPNLSLELCFASALMISGALKSETFRFKGAWPYVNGLVIAGTGAGKSTLKDIVERTLESCGLRGKYPQLFGFQNSVQSLHTALYTAGGSGTTIIDESGDYLQTITGKNAPGYAKALKKYFKEATTGKDQGTWLHPGGSLSYNVPPINGGMLALWMLIQPDKFMGSLSLEDMADGFLPRFFLFNGKTNVKLTRFMNEESGTETFSPSLDLKVYLESLVSLMPCLEVTAVTEEAEKELKEKTPKAKLDAINAHKRDAVYLARSEARKMKNIKVTITEAAHALVCDYLKEKEADAIKSFHKNGESDPALGVFVRMEEMLMRLLCNAVSYRHQTKSAIIDQELAAACIKFHRFQTDRFFSRELEEMSKGSGERESETVFNALANTWKKKGKRPVAVGELTRSIKNTKRPKNIHFVLDELVKRGAAIKETRKSNKGAVTPYYIPIEEDVNEI